MNESQQLRDLELDALKEVANVGAGHAATALSQLTNRRVMIDVPEVAVCPIEEAANAVGNGNSVVAAVLMHVLGDLTGRSLLLFEKECAMRLAQMLLDREESASRVFGELEQSSIKETANILTGAYLNGLSDLLGLMLIPSVPSLAVDLCGAILSTTYLNFGHDRSYVIILDTRFKFEPGESSMEGHFVLLPDPASLRVILKAARVK
ncbi:MAG: chemotaxis protein CheC [Gemmatimonadetes bacterium]|uniref:Chemotaxis protein CheC n=1 Tax=Candidatus Kutchimonas denitrificans TaxID=3056748 RepID=A0AAE4Z711_9BACT|nr:chemotaxis protein CheC [Gemmatimonadota bacterium]NIR74524.1 chemotaxis protein CheC [Candidatus Kutchimonas denitrificans]NIS02714.1 chemotaxis protein CheC [Gemmatimonadota bacterium]NIT68875.1 chemotaxis protein CheC [Gemmatimonadota bacterium]NIU52180.1 CheY-P-specific phosphatase CheC [Gemmatimonadota bacterium]